ncbi:ATP-binding protein [Streptomyces albus]|uniref:ATP-binding protein n=1 Tax=Streptomyces albus TaxID=1888 RepID=UPI0024E12E94|nr:ATP-binding protein [Streptomyces albus]
MGTEGPTALEPLWEGLPTPERASVSGSASCALPPRDRSVSGARDFVRRTLGHWDLTEQYDDVALVVTELVTNAMRHGLTPGADHGAASGDEGDPPVRLHLMRWSSRLVCAVRDPSVQPPDVSALHRAATWGPARRGLDGPRGLPGHGDNGGHGGHGGVVDAVDAWDASCASGSWEPEAPGFTAESGRGLRLVDSFSDSWGWHLLSGPLAGKIVWALFRLGHASAGNGRCGGGNGGARGGRSQVSGASGRRTHRP